MASTNLQELNTKGWITLFIKKNKKREKKIPSYMSKLVRMTFSSFWLSMCMMG